MESDRSTIHSLIKQVMHENTLRMVRRLAALPPTVLFSALLSHAADSPPASAPVENKPVAIGSRRELFVDDALVARLTGKAELRLHHPVPREIAITHDAPWEGSACGYHSIFQDGAAYRMYYRGMDLTVEGGKLKTHAHPMFYCYAESRDGIHWTKPKLGLHEFNGSKANNIVMVPGASGSMTLDMENAAFFRDTNPNASPDARYKALVHSRKPNGMAAFKSADGLRWSPMSDAPVITAGAFDSHNIAFWDAARGGYRAYWRYFTAGVTNENTWKPAGHRDIRTAVSKDFIHWEDQHDLTYGDAPAEELYTNAVLPYHRAPQLFIGLPTRYLDRGWSTSMRALPETNYRELRASVGQRLGTALTEGLLMTSRDGVRFKRWNEAFVRPGIERPGTWFYGSHYPGWQIVETKSALEGAPNELSLYATEHYWTGAAKAAALRRYTLRLDGFVSVSAPMSGGELVTKPIVFQGGRLAVNFATSAAGGVRIEIQDAAGRPLPGFTLEDCPPIFGDSIERTVAWNGGEGVNSLAGKPVRLRFVLNDADVFSFRFIP